MPTKHKPGSLTNRYKKQNGLHHKHNNRYLKVYWPYLPVIAVVLGGVIYSVIVLANKPDTSIASASISVNSLVSSTNAARQASGLAALQVNSELATAAQIKANDMAMKDYWAPVSPSGESPWQVIQSTGYQYNTAGENLAYGFSSAATLSSAWLNSPSHRQNILNSSFDDVGFGVANVPDYLGEGPETIVVAFYASDNTAKTIPSSSTNNEPFTSASISEPNSLAITKAESLTNKSSTITLLITGLLVGAIGCFLILKHGLLLRKWAVESEELIIKHPIVDMILVLVLVGAASLSQTIGFIR
jgi:hypothetical protein